MLSFVSRSVRRLSPSPGAPSAATLMARLAAGDTTALEAIYRIEAGAVYRFALALSGNAAWAADATHDAFVALADRPGGFDAARGSLAAYLAGMARHALLAQYRQARSLVPWPADDDEADGLAGRTDGPASPEALLVQEQDSHRVWDAIRALPFGFREALVLVDLQGRSYAEAAGIAGVETNTLRTRLHRGRLKLAQILGARELVR